MGKGLYFKCCKCGCERVISLGKGILFFEEYFDLKNKVAEGKYGKRIANFYNNQAVIPFSGDRAIFLCEQCKGWITGYDLNFVRHNENDPDKPIIVYEYVKRCKKCKCKRKMITDVYEITELRCPKCDTINNCSSWNFFYWD